ncbi:peptidase S8/S53 domain-containing protein [Chlamydoabsidia padenii]|nr:peptidase S8/S53 domain-containing protein [Chlamydoabsidia padenii]
MSSPKRKPHHHHRYSQQVNIIEIKVDEIKVNETKGFVNHHISSTSIFSSKPVVLSPSPSSILPSTSLSLAHSSSIRGKTKSIINLSLCALYNQVVEQVIQLGIHVVVAAGNYGEDACLYSPGSSPGVITVGAIDRDDSIAYYSNFGKCVDMFAPGTDIKSITSDSDTATKTLTGTSMAAPHVAGSMALFLAQADYTPFELSNYMKNISTLIYLDFAINDTDGNTNKSILDNAIH